LTEEESPSWDDYYKENDVKEMPWFLEKLDHDLQNVISEKSLKNGKFLDLGTGPGTQAMHLSALGFEVVGSDLSQNAIKKAEALYSEPTFVVDDILNSKFSDNAFDCIFDRGIFHVFEENQLSSYLSQVRRILKKNGLLFLKCMSVDEKKISKGEGAKLYSQDQIREFFGNHFEIETIKNSLFYGPTPEPYEAIFAVMINKK